MEEEEFRAPATVVEEVPPGWDYNPSRWSQRLYLIALGAIGFLLARVFST